MSFNKRHFTPVFKFSGSDLDFISISDFATDYPLDTKHRVRALHINENNQFGPSAVLTTDEVKLNLPSHLTKTVQSILSNRVSVQEINEGIVGFTLVEYENNHGKQYSIDWCPLPPL